VLFRSHFFIILAKSDRISDEQRKLIFNFSLTSMNDVRGRAVDRLDGVIMGNDHIDRDLAYARSRFECEREQENANARVGQNESDRR